jgi:hypothetical protein
LPSCRVGPHILPLDVFAGPDGTCDDGAELSGAVPTFDDGALAAISDDAPPGTVAQLTAKTIHNTNANPTGNCFLHIRSPFSVKIEMFLSDSTITHALRKVKLQNGYKIVTML